jgi:hypothetical protein
MFIGTLNDIRNKLLGNEYDLLRACGLLRHLLLDQPNLVYLANQKFDLKFTYHVCDYITKPPFKPLIHFISLEPNTRITYQVKENKLKHIPVLTFNEQDYTVIDVINSAAHKMGGVHSYPAKKDAEKNLMLLDEVLKKLPIQYLPVFYTCIASICEVVLKGLEPLEKAIKEHTPTGEN